MYFATVDSGTTYSRVAVVDWWGRVIGKASVKAGVRDTAVTGSRQALRDGIQLCFDEAVSRAELQVADVGVALAAGMISSEIGLLEVPHLTAPIGVAELAAGVVKVHDTAVFPVDIPVYFIPGIKNRYDPERISIEDVGKLDFMRGEEVQVIGLMQLGKVAAPGLAAILSSHTKIVVIDAAGRIAGSITTLSGQIYEAVRSQTSIGKSIRPDDDSEEAAFADYWDEAIVANAFDWVRRAGISRTFLMTRFLDVLLHRPWYERRLFVESAIAAEDLHAIGQVDELAGGLHGKHLVLAGSPRRARILEYLLERAGIRVSRSTVSDPDEIDSLSVHGLLAVARRAGLMEGADS